MMNLIILMITYYFGYKHGYAKCIGDIKKAPLKKD